MTNTTPSRIKSYRKNAAGRSDCDVCARCGAHMPAPTLYVVTTQGEYPIGPDCADAVRAEGFEVVDAEAS